MKSALLFKMAGKIWSSPTTKDGITDGETTANLTEYKDMNKVILQGCTSQALSK